MPGLEKRCGLIDEVYGFFKT